MKHIFIINPAAGKGQTEKVFVPKIMETVKKMSLDYEIHRTMGVEDSIRYIKNKIKERDHLIQQGQLPVGIVYRFYSCGGDGTLNEVVNGAYGEKDIEVALIPAGTGNDFVRNFQNKENFKNIEKLVRGKVIPIDLLCYKSSANIQYIQNDEGARYAINMINVGLDCHVVYHMESFRKLPLVTGSFAYYGGVVKALVNKKTTPLEIFMENVNEIEESGGLATSHKSYQHVDCLLFTVGNGRFYGGGFQGAPLAEVTDGKMDVTVVQNISYKRLMKLIYRYKKGTHLEIPGIEKYITYTKCNKITIKNPEYANICVDGEIKEGNDTEITLIKEGIPFVLPEGSS